MEEPCVAPECALSCPMVRNAPEAVDHLRLGVVVDAPAMTAVMTAAVAAPLSDADHQGGGASAVVAAGPFQGTGGEIGLFPKRGTINPQDLSHAQGVVPGLMIGSEFVGGSRRRIMFGS